MIKTTHSVNQKVAHYDIAVCVPTKNESLTIANVVSIIDAGLKKYYANLKSIIINIDSQSIDNTTSTFLKTPTTSEKLAVSADIENKTGKGINIYKFLNIAKDMRATCGVVIDGDLESIAPEWIWELVQPIISGESDFVAPLYSRHKYDATITNHLCFPIIYAEWGEVVRQPIGGEFSFSQRYIVSALNDLDNRHTDAHQTTDAINAFGIDIFLTTHAIQNKFLLQQSYLGRKTHRFREIHTLKSMFLDVTTVLFYQIRQNRQNISNSLQAQLERVLTQKPTPAFEIDMEIDSDAITRHLLSEFSDLNSHALETYFRLTQLIDSERASRRPREALLAVDTSQWTNIIKLFIRDDLFSPTLGVSLQALYPLFLARIYDHFSNVKQLSYAESESLLFDQASLLNENYH
jgi:glycosyltransferase involved in cell wall biosynthesis